jgi:hypothetical protein
MAKAKSRKVISVTLDLSEEEARFILELTRNYFRINNIPEEPEQHAKIRRSVFEALKEELGG